MDHPRTASQKIVDSMDAVFSTRAKAAAVLRTAAEICMLAKSGESAGIEGILEIASELDGSPILR